MLTGELAPTSGYFEIYGKDVRSSWEEAKSYLGVCPQQAILPPHMTVQEILQYYTKLKGTPSDKVQADVEK